MVGGIATPGHGGPAGSADALRLDRRTTLLWGFGGVASLLLGYCFATAPVLALLALGGIGGLGVLVLVFAQPRWALLVQLGLASMYAHQVVSEQSGFAITPQTVTILMLIGVLARRVLDVERVPLPREAAWIGVLLATMVVSSLLAEDAARSFRDVLEVFEIGVLAVLVVALIDSATWLRRALWAFALGVGVLSVLAVVQQVTATYEFDYLGLATVVEGDQGLMRTSGPTDPNFLAQLVLAATVVSAYLAFSARSGLERALGFTLAAAGVGAILFTYSRGALLAGGAALGAATILRRVKPWIPILAAVTLFVIAALVLPPDAKERFLGLAKPGQSGIAHAEDSSVANRFAENLAAIYMFRDYPLTGVGPGNYSLRYEEYAQAIGLDLRAEERAGVEQAAHNLYLETLGERGVFGAAAFFAVIGMGFVGAWRARARLPGRDALLGEGLFVALVGYFVASFFLHDAYPYFLWIVVTLGLAAGRVARDTHTALREAV